MTRMIVEGCDIDGDGEIDFGEFVTLMARVKEEVEEESEPETEPDDEKPLIQLTAELAAGQLVDFGEDQQKRSRTLL